MRVAFHVADDASGRNFLHDRILQRTGDPCRPTRRSTDPQKYNSADFHAEELGLSCHEEINSRSRHCESYKQDATYSKRVAYVKPEAEYRQRRLAAVIPSGRLCRFNNAGRFYCDGSGYLPIGPHASGRQPALVYIQCSLCAPSSKLPITSEATI